MWDLDAPQGGCRFFCGLCGRQGSPYAQLFKRRGGVEIVINENVSHSAAEATQQHVVLYQDLVYFWAQWWSRTKGVEKILDHFLE